jgi:antitoxin component YwqK of YwqJK toxin-antitoxin module
MKDGKKHGTRRVWQENGRLFFLEDYREGKLKRVIYWNKAGECCGKSEIVAGFGIVRRYDEAGSLESECPYRNGVPHGVCRVGGTAGGFRDDEYVDGKLNGWSRAYRANGQLNWEAQYRDDLLHGVSRKWGNVEDEKQVLLSEEFHIRGVKVSESEYLREGNGSASSAPK